MAIYTTTGTGTRSRSEAEQCAMAGGIAEAYFGSCFGWEEIGPIEATMTRYCVDACDKFRIVKPAPVDHKPEYPRKCTKREAIECALAGGKAGLKGVADRVFTQIIPINREAKYRLDNGELSNKFNDGWDYQITKPPSAKEYPKSCTRDEALYCVKSGGQAQLRRLTNENWIDMEYDCGRVYYRVVASRKFGLLDCWQYQITEPAPIKSTESNNDKPKLVSTTEAIYSVLNGQGAVYAIGDAVSLRLGWDAANQRIISTSGTIPMDCKWSIKIKSKPDPVTVTTTFSDDAQDIMWDQCGDALDDMLDKWNGKLKVEFTITAVDE
jgi:hypothetical protein